SWVYNMLHHVRSDFIATGAVISVLRNDIGNSLRLSIRIGFKQVANLDSADLHFRVGVLFAAPYQESHDGGKNSDDQKLHGVKPMFRVGRKENSIEPLTC